MSLERIVKLLPLGAVLLIGLGVLKTSIYYNYFEVDIMSYLSTTEVLTLFLNDFQPILVLVLVGLIHMNISERFIEGIENTVGTDRFEKVIRSKKWGYVVFFAISAFAIISVIYFQGIELQSWLIYLFVFSLVQLVFFLFVRKEGELLIRNESFFHIFSGICILLVIPLMSLKDIRQVEQNKGQNVVLTMKDDSVVVTTKENRFLGKAGENYFFYNPKKKITTSMKSENVERIEIKK